MKRRLFLQGLLGASAVAPVIAKAITKPVENKMPEGGFIVPKGSIDRKELLPIKPSKILIEKDPWKEAFMPGVKKWYGDNWNK